MPQTSLEIHMSKKRHLSHTVLCNTQHVTHDTSHMTFVFFFFPFSSFLSLLVLLLLSEHVKRFNVSRVLDIYLVISFWVQQTAVLSFSRVASFKTHYKTMPMLHSEILSPPKFNAISDLLSVIGGH